MGFRMVYLRFVSFFVFLVLLPNFFGIVAQAETAAQRLALYEFYQSTNQGSGWAEHCADGWSAMESGPVSSICDSAATTIPNRYYSTLYGVYCHAPSGELIYLTLPGCNLQGTLVDSLSNFSYLTFLYLWDNQLEGTLPSAWETLIRIQQLGMQNNRLSGTLPPSWAAMTSIQRLFLQNNRLTGTLPLEWDTLTAEYLYLFSNLLTGTVPPWNAMPNIKHIYLSSNLLTGSVPEWSGLKSLTAVSFGANGFSGDIPLTWLTNFDDLEEFDVSSNLLNGTIPGLWSSRLQNLYLQKNRFWGPLPAMLSGSNIQKLYFNGNNLTGTLPSQWTSSQLPSLTHVDVSRNSLTGELPSSWSSLAGLLHLNVGNNSLTGTLPNEWLTFRSCEQLFLSNNFLNGTIPSGWSSMRNLTQIQIENNQLRGTLPRSWGATMQRLTEVRLSKNQLEGDLPSEWASMISLKTIDVSSNQLTGFLPSSWSAMSRLSELYLHINNFVGQVPQEWPENLREINRTSGYCAAVCTGTVGVNAVCVATGSPSCVAVSLWYNCVKQALPPNNVSNTWNWRSVNLYLGPQRKNCLVTASVTDTKPFSVSVTETSSSSQRLTTTVSEPQTKTLTRLRGMNPRATRTESLSQSANLSSTVTNPCTTRPLADWLHTPIPSPDAIDRFTWSTSTMALVDGNDVLGKRCIVLEVSLPVESQWHFGEIRAKDVSLRGDEISNEMDNITVFVSSNPTREKNRNATLWLCTTREGGLSLSGIHSTTLFLFVAVPVRCAENSMLTPFLTLRVFFSTRDPVEVAVSSAVATARSEPVTRAVTRFSPVLQRAGGSACQHEPDTGIWKLDLGSDKASKQRGTILGNILFVVVAWLSISIYAVTCALFLHKRGSLLKAIASSHVASIAAPLFSMIVVPLTSNSTSLLLSAAVGDLDRSPDRSTSIVVGSIGLLIIFVNLGAVFAVCLVARRILVVESLLNLGSNESHLRDNFTKRFAIFLRALHHEHWVAVNETGVSFKQHAQLILGEASGWWYFPAEAFQGTVVGVVDGLGSCLASVYVGAASQFILLAAVMCLRPHGDSIGHCTTCLTLLLSGVAVVLPVVAGSAWTRPAAETSAAFLLAATGITVVRLTIAVVGVVHWTLGWKRRKAGKSAQNLPSETNDCPAPFVVEPEPQRGIGISSNVNTREGNIVIQEKTAELEPQRTIDVSSNANSQKGNIVVQEKLSPTLPETEAPKNEAEDDESEDYQCSFSGNDYQPHKNPLKGLSTEALQTFRVASAKK